MTFEQLEALYEMYAKDKNTANLLFQGCLTVARQQLSLHTSGLDREEVAQAATVAAWEKFHTFKPREGKLFAFWFLTIIRSKLNDLYRAESQRKEWIKFNASAAPIDHDYSFFHERTRAVAGDHQRLIDLALSGMTYSEIADELGTTQSAVRQRLSQMKKRHLKAAAEASPVQVIN